MFSLPVTKSAITAMAATLLAIAFFFGPIHDIDFWWHANHGRWIFANHEIPQVDPFGIYAEINYWGKTILQGQWAGQLILFLAYDTGGAHAVIALRAALLLGTLGLVYLRLRAAQASKAAILLALLLLAVILAGFGTDRPQLFSLAAFSLLVYVLEKAAVARAWQWGAIPLLVAWTNLHQAVLLGAVVAATWLVVLALEDRRDGRPFADRLAAAAGALLSPLVTPNGLRGIEYAIWLEFEPAKQRISEYQSPIALLGNALQFPHLIAYFIIALGVLAWMAHAARRKPLEVIIPGMLLAASLGTYRYIPFVAIMAMPRLAAAIRPGQPAFGVLLGVYAVAGIAAASIWMQGRLATLGEPVLQTAFPVVMTEKFGSAIKGRVFTTVSWGGYLGWTQAGAAVPFIDGRYLMDTRRLDEYTHILWATARGRLLLDRHDFDWVVIPVQNQFAAPGEEYRLIPYLGSHPDWELKMLTPQGVAFARRRI